MQGRIIRRALAATVALLAFAGPAQAQTIDRNGSEAVIATANVRHLAIFSPARIRREIG